MHQLPVFVASKPQKIHVVTGVTAIMRDRHKRSVQALIYKELDQLAS
jgi:hypothetical protein